VKKNPFSVKTCYPRDDEVETKRGHETILPLLAVVVYSLRMSSSVWMSVPGKSPRSVGQTRNHQQSRSVKMI
jgi:hypothetical protein